MSGEFPPTPSSPRPARTPAGPDPRTPHATAARSERKICRRARKWQAQAAQAQRPPQNFQARHKNRQAGVITPAIRSTKLSSGCSTPIGPTPPHARIGPSRSRLPPPTPIRLRTQPASADGYFGGRRPSNHAVSPNARVAPRKQQARVRDSICTNGADHRLCQPGYPTSRSRAGAAAPDQPSTPGSRIKARRRPKRHKSHSKGPDH